MPSGRRLNSDAALEEIDDEVLMRGVAAGDPKSFERLYDRYSARIFAFCLRSIGDRCDAEDLVVEIFWEIWRHQDRYEPHRSSPLSYLMKVTRSRIIDRLRANRARRGRMAVAADDSSPGHENRAASALPAIDQAVNSEQQERLRGALGQLTSDQRQALELAYFDALSYSEVADSLGQPLGTVKSRIRQALKQLRELLRRTEQ